MILTEIELEDALSVLSAVDKELLLITFKIQKPDDWTAPWPPQISQIGKYLGLKYEGKPLSEAAVRYRKKVVLESLRGLRTPLRRRGKLQ